jgi:hypothetical protein
MRLYNENGVRTSLSKHALTLITYLLQTAVQLGCKNIPGITNIICMMNDNTVNINNTTNYWNDIYNILQIRVLTCIALLSFSSMHGFTGRQLPYNIEIPDILYHLQDSILALEHITNIESKSLIFSCQFRSLFRTMSLLREAVRFANADISICASVSRAAYIILQRASLRYDTANCYLNWCGQLSNELITLHQEELKKNIIIQDESVVYSA